MAQEEFDVSSICNVLVDLLIEVSEEDLKSFQLEKGKMHLVNKVQQNQILETCRNPLNKVELGGSSLNTIKALAQLGCRVSFSGMIGEDAYGSIAKQSMDDLGIVSQLQKHEEEETGKSLILITPDGQRTMNTYLGASCFYQGNPKLFRPVEASRFFHFCGYQWACPTQREIALESIRVAKENGCLVSFDLADPFVVRENRTEFLELIKKDVDIYFGNRDETKILFEDSSRESFLKDHPDVISVLKLDADGALVSYKGEEIKVDPIRVNVVDTTGAGDMFAAGFLCGLVNGLDLSTSGHIATILASDVISHFGASLSKEALQRVQRLVSEKRAS